MHQDNNDAIKKMTYLEKLREDLESYENKYTGIFNSTSAIQYSVLYHRQALTELLKKELPSVLNKTEYIENVADLASIRYCKKVVHQLAMKYVTENVNKINNSLKNTHIKEDDILYKNEDSFQAYYNTVVILDSLTYKDNLIASFERFLRRRHIKLSLGNPKYRFCFTFTNGLIEHKYAVFFCNNVFEFFDFCPKQMLEDCCNELISVITSNVGIIQNYPIENYDVKKIAILRGKELYEYLNQFEFMQINYDLEDLYLLLYYEDITIFKDDDVMESLKLRLIHNEI